MGSHLFEVEKIQFRGNGDALWNDFSSFFIFLITTISTME